MMYLYTLTLSVLALVATSQGQNLRANSGGDRRDLGIFHAETASISVGASSICPHVPVELTMNLQARRHVPESISVRASIECDVNASYGEVMDLSIEKVVTTFKPPAGDSCEVRLLAWYEMTALSGKTIYRARQIASSSFKVMESSNPACATTAAAGR
jgi:hypothetical protein